MDIHSNLTEIFRDTFGDPGLDLTDETTAEDVAMWDSTTHIVLIFAIEDRFGFKFAHSDLEGLGNVGDLKAAINRRVTAA